MAIGLLGIVAGTAGISRALWRAAPSANQAIPQAGSDVGTTWPADAAALSGLAVAAAALLAAILLEWGRSSWRRGLSASLLPSPALLPLPQEPGAGAWRFSE